MQVMERTFLTLRNSNASVATKAPMVWNMNDNIQNDNCLPTMSSFKNKNY